MARARNIKPGFFRNADLVELPFEARLLFIGLWTIADKAGRMEDRPKQIKMELFPADNLDCDALLSMLHELGMIDRYTVENKKYIQVVNFSKHQNPHRDEKTSVIPDKNGVVLVEDNAKHGASTVQTQCKDDSNTVAIGLIPDSLNTDSLNTDSLNTDSLETSKDLSAPSALTSKKGTRLPEDWVLPKAWGEWALSEKQGWTADDVRSVAANFKDHWLANANQAKSKKSDWLATWRIWVRSPLNGIKPGSASGFQTAGERRMAVTDAAIDAWLSEGSGNVVEGELVNV